jgi:cellulose synthase/poly-beta-1,6-N-acetylglucosamine synthase-like glycosyltransferase
MEIALILVYTLALSLIFFYSLAQLNLLFNYIKAQKKEDVCPKFDFSDPEQIPFVTLQLPVFNELYVVERLLDTIALLDYPKEKLDIQVLDDSTDESVKLTAQKVEKLKKMGFDIEHIRRTNRVGFKAGALKEGLKIAKGEFVAIFDADFLPQKDFLLKTIPHFKNDGIGVVQTRWGHINRNYSLLTKMQAFALDAHFTIEQVGRNTKNHFINFNGTAGVWRKSCIEDAGNWQSDTLTEDLDLSYRSQLKGWKFKYLEDVETPAELPVVISAARSQQFRWNKGGAENFRKMNRTLMKATTTPLKTRIHGFIHLLNSSMFLSIFVVAILSIPMLYIKDLRPEYKSFFQFTSVFVLSTFIFFACYWYAYKRIHGRSIKSFMSYVKDFFFFFSVAMGFSLHNSVAVLEGHLGKKSAFVRTPKFNIKNLKDGWKKNKYVQTKLSLVNFVEGFLVLYFLFGIFSAFKLTDYGLLPFHLMLFFGFGFVFYKSITCKV